jgi:SAM-dependent methyltransferase
MGFDDSFDRVIRSRLRADARLRRAVFDRICEHGQADFNDLATAMCYCMCYMYQHFDANLLVLHQAAAAAPRLDDAIIIDVGSGPGTAALALAHRDTGTSGRPVQFAYVGIDRTPLMHTIAQEFLEDPDLFGKRFQADFVTTFADVKIEAYARRRTAIFYCSYILNQDRFISADCDALAELIRSVKRSAVSEGYLLVADVNRGQPTNYLRLAENLRGGNPRIALDTRDYRNYADAIVSNKRSPRVVGGFFDVTPQEKRNVAFALQRLW